MTAPTAALIIRDLDRRQLLRQMDVLGGLDDVASDAVRHALSAVPRSAKIDVHLLVDSVRRSIAARAEAEAANGNAWRYELELRIAAATSGDLHRLKDELQDARERGEDDAGPIMRQFLDRLAGIAARLRETTPAPAHTTAHAEPDAEPDDDEPARPRIPRVRSRTAAHGEQRTSARPKAATGPILCGRLLGVGDDRRPFGASIDYSPSYQHFDPPWLIKDESEEEKDDEFTSTRADAY
jgi:hypothetical protein